MSSLSWVDAASSHTAAFPSAVSHCNGGSRVSVLVACNTSFAAADVTETECQAMGFEQ